MEYRREIIQFTPSMSVADYIQEIGAYAYTDEQYYNIALTHIKIRQIVELRNILLSFILFSQNNTFNKIVRMKQLDDLGHDHTEELNSLLDLYNVCCKSSHIDEHETIKSYNFFKNVLNDNLASNLANLNKYLVKLEIEERILSDGVGPYEERFCNYEDVYERL